jgi:hypothetical protein
MRYALRKEVLIMFADSVTPKGFFNTSYVVITGLFGLIVDAVIAIALAVIMFAK